MKTEAELRVQRCQLRGYIAARQILCKRTIKDAESGCYMERTAQARLYELDSIDKILEGQKTPMPDRDLAQEKINKDRSWILDITTDATNLQAAASMVGPEPGRFWGLGVATPKPIVNLRASEIVAELMSLIGGLKIISEAVGRADVLKRLSTKRYHEVRQQKTHDKIRDCLDSYLRDIENLKAPAPKIDMGKLMQLIRKYGEAIAESLGVSTTAFTVNRVAASFASIRNYLKFCLDAVNDNLYKPRY